MSLIEIATGVLGWPPSEAFTSDPAYILNAYEAKVDYDDDLHRTIMRAAGHKVPPKESRQNPKPPARSFSQYAKSLKQDEKPRKK